jgi:hypothetical protein
MFCNVILCNWSRMDSSIGYIFMDRGDGGIRTVAILVYNEIIFIFISWGFKMNLGIGKNSRKISIYTIEFVLVVKERGSIGIIMGAGITMHR